MLVWAVSQYKPIMITRTMFWAVPMLAIGLAVVGHGVLPRYVLRAALIATIALGVAHSVYQNHRDHKQDYRPLMEMAYELGTDQTVYYGSSHTVSWTIEYLRRDQQAETPSWVYLAETKPRVSISKSPVFFDEAIEQMEREDDIMLVVRKRYGLDDYLLPGLEKTHTFSLLGRISEKWESGVLYRVQRRTAHFAE